MRINEKLDAILTRHFSTNEDLDEKKYDKNIASIVMRKKQPMNQMIVEKIKIRITHFMALSAVSWKIKQKTTWLTIIKNVYICIHSFML